MRRSPAPGTSPAGRWCSAACSSPPGRPTASRRRSATPASSRTRAPTRSRRSSIPACSACLLFILVPFTFQGVLGLNGMLATPIVDGSGVADAMAQHGRRRRASSHSLLVMLMILALMLCHHDGDGRLVAHALPGLGRRLAAALSRATSTSMARRPAPCGPTSSSTCRARDRLGRRDQLLLHPRRVELRLHHLQLPQPQRRLDPPHRQRPHRAALEGADLR